MFRLVKALSLTLAIAAVTLVATGCGSKTQVRVYNSIYNGPSGGLDVYFNGSKDFIAVGSGTGMGILPAQTNAATYQSVPSGTTTVQAYTSGNNTNNLIGTNVPALTLDASTQYTVFLNGSNVVGGAQDFVLKDVNTTPATGDVEIRVVHSSPNGPSDGVDVYIVPCPTVFNPPQNLVNTTALTNTQYINYDPISYNSQTSCGQNGTANYEFVVTDHGSGNPIVNEYYALPTGSITTLILVDTVTNGQPQMSPTPIVLNDLQ